MSHQHLKFFSRVLSEIVNYKQNMKNIRQECRGQKTVTQKVNMKLYIMNRNNKQNYGAR